MSLGELHEDLEQHIEGLHDEEKSKTFVVDDLSKADWAVRKIARARRRLTDAQLVADAERARIDEWIAGERHRCETDTAYLASLLEGFHRQALDDDPKAKTITLPAGQLVARRQPDRAEYVDVEGFTAWAQNGHGELLRVKVEPDKATVKKFTKPDGDRLVLVETGEPVPGVTWTEGHVSFSVKTDEDGAA